MRGGVEDVLIVREEIAAGGASLAGGDHMLIRSVGIHYKNLIALQLVARGLEDQALAVWSPVRLGVLTAEGELPDVVEMRWSLR